MPACWMVPSRYRSFGLAAPTPGSLRHSSSRSIHGGSVTSMSSLRKTSTSPEAERAPALHLSEKLNGLWQASNLAAGHFSFALKTAMRSDFITTMISKFGYVVMAAIEERNGPSRLALSSDGMINETLSTEDPGSNTIWFDCACGTLWAGRPRRLNASVAAPILLIRA